MEKAFTTMDYVEIYANKLKEDNRLFAQQKMLIESQLKGSASLFGRMFAGKDFKIHTRKYLRDVGLL